MSATRYVQIWQDGVCLQQIPFTAERLQVGRLPDNDVVINHLSVSRTHALLEREGDQIAVQDLGSQNGVWADGHRLESRALFPLGSSVGIGQHELRFTSAESSVEPSAARPVSELEAPAGTRSQPDVVDALASSAIEEDELGSEDVGPLAQSADLHVDDLFGATADGTFLVEPPSAEGPAPELPGPELPRPDHPRPDHPGSLPDENEVNAVSSPDLDGDDEPLSIPSLDDEGFFEAIGAPSPEPVVGSPFDDTGQGLAWNGTPSEPAASGEGPMYAGLIVQRAGALESVLPWDADEMVAGRGPDCEVLLAEPEVSRQHAVFVRRIDGSHLVRDLGSINGVFVNDEKVDEQVLAVGDVVRIENFALTFLLDHQPIGNEVRLPEPPAPSPATDLEKGHMTVLGELPPLDATPPPVRTSRALPSVDLLDEDLDPAQDSDTKEEEAALHLELEVSMADLPESLRRALAELGDQALCVPVSLRVRR